MVGMRVSAFDANTLKFSELIKNKNKNNAKSVYLFGNPATKEPIVIQTPLVYLPFGYSTYADPATGAIQSLSLDVSFRGFDEDPKIAEFLESMQTIDKVIMAKAVEASKEWFGKPMSEETIRELYRPLVRAANDPKYAPTMRVKVATQGGTPTALFFDEDRKPVKLESVTKGSKVRLMIQLGSVWFVGGNFGITFRLQKCHIVSRPRQLSDDFDFDDDDDEEETNPLLDTMQL